MTTPLLINSPATTACTGTVLTFTSRVVDPITGATGRVNMVWPAAGPDQATTYYRVVFPPGSPFVDDWTVFREGELTPAPPEAEAPKPVAYKEDYPTTTP